MREKRTKEIDGCKLGNESGFVRMLLVFCFVFKDGRDLGMLIKRREETNRGGN